MTTADLRWAPASRSASAPTVDTDEFVYIGKHRKSGTRVLSLFRMMYRPRHRAR